jgi:hypothetical protein
MPKQRFVNLNDHTLASKNQWRVDTSEPPAANILEVLVALNGSHLCDLCFLCTSSDRIFPDPPMDYDNPLLQREPKKLPLWSRLDIAT